jgi:hypothetical protein
MDYEIYIECNQYILITALANIGPPLLPLGAVKLQSHDCKGKHPTLHIAYISLRTEGTIRPHDSQILFRLYLIFHSCPLHLQHFLLSKFVHQAHGHGDG